MPKLKGLALEAASPVQTSQIMCGFCRTGGHGSCPRAVANGERPRKIWPCSCREPGCMGGGVLRCLDCKTEMAGEVSPSTWQCIDLDACRARQNRRLDANPVIQQLREFTTVPTIGETKPTKRTAKAAVANKPRREPRDCTCGCGEQTGGGLFRPGHDARLVTTKVKEVGEARFTVAAKKAALKEFKDAGVSEALVAKYEKSLLLSEGRAKSQAAKPAAAKPAAAAGPKPAAKRAGKKAAAPAPVADEPDDDDGF